MRSVPDFEPHELRQPPCAIEAEQYVIGAVLLEPKALASVSDWLVEADFFLAKHRAIWQAVNEIASAGKPVDAVTVAEHLDGGADGLTFADVIDVANTTASAANVVAYAEIVLEKSRLRQVMDLGTRLAGAAMRPGVGSADLVSQATHTLAALQAENRGGLRPIKPALKAWFEDLVERYESGRRMNGRATPWLAMNELTHGLRGGELIVVAARPGMGKSVMGFGMATFDALRDGGRVALFSLEMTITEYGQRSVAALGGASHEWLRAPDKGQGSDEQWNRVTGGMTKLLEANIVVDDTPGLTVAQIAARARRAHMQSPLSMVVVDHMHIVRIKGDNPVRELGDVSRALKALAKELNVPVVALAQLNRSNVARNDKRPTMADLRGSGEIEQDADYIFLLHRQDYYDDSDETGAVEIIVGKSRNAAANTIVLKNRLDVMRFDDWEGPLPSRDEPKKHWRAGRGFDA